MARSSSAPPHVHCGACLFCDTHAAWVDYKDLPTLRRFVGARGKIRARRATGTCAQHQRDLAGAVKLSRELGLLPYAERTVAPRRPVVVVTKAEEA
jgi:small subunit ribosomal protein S18